MVYSILANKSNPNLVSEQILHEFMWSLIAAEIKVFSNSDAQMSKQHINVCLIRSHGFGRFPFEIQMDFKRLRNGSNFDVHWQKNAKKRTFQGAINVVF